MVTLDARPSPSQMLTRANGIRRPAIAVARVAERPLAAS
jgi:hypothetical protein